MNPLHAVKYAELVRDTLAKMDAANADCYRQNTEEFRARIDELDDLACGYDGRPVLERLGIAEYARRHIRDLSGGQQQRAFLARALIRRPELLLLDEPTSGADIKTRHEVPHLLHDLNREGIAVLLTTHDLNSVARRS